MQILPRRGARVSQLSVAKIDEIFVIRANLFGLAARLFAGQARKQDLQTLDGLFKQMKALEPEQATTHAEVSTQMAFVLLDQCGNSRLRAMILQLARQVARYAQLGLLTGDGPRSPLGVLCCVHFARSTRLMLNTLPGK